MGHILKTFVQKKTPYSPRERGHKALVGCAASRYCSMYCFRSCRWLTLSFCSTSEI